MSSKLVIIGLDLQGGGVSVVFSSVAPIMLVIGLKLVSLHDLIYHFFVLGIISNLVNEHKM